MVVVDIAERKSKKSAHKPANIRPRAINSKGGILMQQSKGGFSNGGCSRFTTRQKFKVGSVKLREGVMLTCQLVSVGRPVICMRYTVRRGRGGGGRSAGPLKASL
jgi:hypothetical protein